MEQTTIRDNATLRDLAATIPEILSKSIAPNTLKSYAQGYKTWKQWSSTFTDIQNLPAKAADVALFIAATIQANGKFGKIESMYNGLNWIHTAINVKNPCDSGMVRKMREAAKRILSKPVKKKTPISPYNLKQLTKKLRKNINVLSMRTLNIALISYAGFLRYDEVIELRGNDIMFEKSYVKIFLKKSKGDQENKGDWVYIARTMRPTCPYKNLREYLKLAEVGKNQFIFRATTRTKMGYKLKQQDKPICYTTARQSILQAIESIGLDRKAFGLHSFRRGGATTAARAGVKDRLFKKHGRWRSENAKDGYVSEDLETRLSVSRKLGI